MSSVLLDFFPFLLPYQVDALNFMCSRKKSGLLVPTGGGKTILACVYCKILDEPVLIITQAKLKDLFEKDVKKFKKLYPDCILDLDIGYDYRQGAKILVVSYEYIKNNVEIMDDFDNVIIDEALCLSNTETIRFKNLSEVLKNKKRVLLMAGYPVENHLTELYVFSLITEVLGTCYQHFLNKFFTVIRHPKNRKRIIKIIEKKNAFNEIISLLSPYVFTIPKSVVMGYNINKDIKVDIKILRYDLSDQQIEILESLRDNLEYKCPEFTFKCKNDLVVFHKSLQIISGFVYPDDEGKTQAPIFFNDNPKFALMSKIVEGHENYLMWYMYDAEAEMLDSISGCRLSNLNTDAKGLNLQSFNFSIYYSIPLSGGKFLQSIDRLYRFGRENDVVVILLVPNGIYGDKLLDITIGKKILSDKVKKSFINCSFRK